jgi:hypothetical protein
MQNFKLLFASAWLAFVGACAVSDDDGGATGDLADEAELAETEHAIEATALPLCPDLPNQTFTTFEGCTLNGQLGTKKCTQTCTIHRTPVFKVTGMECKITGSTCGPKVCGPCGVITPEGPLDPL